MKRMKRKKIFGIGAAVLLVTLTFSSTVTSETENELDKEFIQAISEFVENNKEELETIGGFLLDTALDYKVGQPIPVLPQELEMITNDLIIKFQKIIIDYYNITNPSNYYGRCAYYTSNGTAPFLIDEGDTNNYFGHCLALCKAMVRKICDTIERVGFLIILFVTLFFILQPVFGFFYAFILMLIIIPKWMEIKEIFKMAKSYPYGLVLFYFDRVDKTGSKWDEIRHYPQPGFREWDPGMWHNQTDWDTVVEY